MTTGHDVLLATVREFTERSGAIRVVVLLDRGDGRAPPTVECEPGEPLTISQGEENFIVPPVDLIGVAPLDIDPPRPVPATAIEVDTDSGQVSAPLGAIHMLAEGVTDLARALGGRTVAVADFATRSGQAMSIAGRAGEPPVLAVGEQQFELPGTP